MTPKSRIVLRLTAPPVLAAAIVVSLALLSLLDLSRTRRRGEEKGLVAVAAREGPGERPRVPLTKDVPQLSEEDALKTLKDRPTRAAVARLWPLEGHREELFKLLLAKTTPEEVRLYLLSAFADASEKKATEAARSIISEKDLGEGPLLFSAYELLARFGEKEDLALFSERPGESHQLKALREEYRDSLRKRTE